MINEITYSAGGGELILDTDWPVADVALLTVKRTRASVETTLVNGTDYTVAGVGGVRGARVILTLPAAEGDTYHLFSPETADQVTGNPGDAAYVIAFFADQGWQTGEAFSRGQVAFHNRAAYVSRVTHTASGATEPGVGADWQTVWRLLIPAPIDGVDGAPGANGADGADGAPGADGADGADGAPGADGADGVGVPAGGATGQALIKASASDYDTAWGNVAAGGGGGAPNAIIIDQKANNVHGGDFTSGAWRTRDLNTIRRNSDGAGGTLVTLANNQFTLPAGDYFARILAPAFRVSRHIVRLYDVTGATELGQSPTAYGLDTEHVMNSAELNVAFTLGVSSTLEVQHGCQVTKTTNGLGLNALDAGDGFSFPTASVYTQVYIWKA